MSFPDEVFQHAPALKGRIKAPGESRMRLTYARFDEMDAQAIAEDWTPGWRMSHPRSNRPSSGLSMLSDEHGARTWCACPTIRTGRLKWRYSAYVGPKY